MSDLRWRRKLDLKITEVVIVMQFRCCSNLTVTWLTRIRRCRCWVEWAWVCGCSGCWFYKPNRLLLPQQTKTTFLDEGRRRCQWIDMPGLGSRFNTYWHTKRSNRWQCSQHTPRVPAASPEFGRSGAHKQDKLSLSCKANKYTNAGTSDLSVVPTHETTPCRVNPPRVNAAARKTALVSSARDLWRAWRVGKNGNIHCNLNW